MGLFKRWRARRAAKKQLKAERKEKELAKENQQEVSNEKVEQKEKPVKQTETKKTETKQTATKTETKDDSFRYHVSQNKDDKSEHFKKWRVRRSNSNKTIKYFETQKEAILYAEELAKRNNTTVVIHKLDGSIRRQNY